jgi:hypothetical protein
MTNNKRSGAIVRRLGPVGLSVVAAAITAAGFAAISLAADDGGDRTKGKDGPTVHRMIVPGPGGDPLGDLSEEDRAALEDFRQCLSEQGAAPPQRLEFDPDNPPEPPSREEMEEIRKAHEACKEKLPDDLQQRLEEIPGPFGGPGCGPGGPPPARKESGDYPGDTQSQSFVVPAPAPSGSSS